MGLLSSVTRVGRRDGDAERVGRQLVDRGPNPVVDWAGVALPQGGVSRATCLARGCHDDSLGEGVTIM